MDAQTSVDKGVEIIGKVAEQNRAQKRGRKTRRVLRQSHIVDKGMLGMFISSGVRISRSTPQKQDKVGEPYSRRRKVLKPYRLIKLQQKIDRLQDGIRALPHNHTERARMVSRMTLIKKQLG